MAFSASDAAFEGFRIVRRDPLAMLAWALLYIVTFALAFALVGGSIIALAQQAEALKGVADPSMEELAPLFGGYMLVFAVVGPLSILVSTVLTAAIVRAVLEPGARRFGFMRIGMDELRLFGVYVVLFALVCVYYLVVAVVCGVLGAMAAASNQPWLFIPVFLVAIAAILGLIWLSVRFSLVAPIVVAEKRIAIFDSFKMTKGRFWPLFGMAILAGVMSLVVSLLGMVIGLPFQLGLAGPFAQIKAGQAMLPILMQSAPLVLGWALVNAVVSALQLAVLYAPFSAAYRDIKAAG